MAERETTWTEAVWQVRSGSGSAAVGPVSLDQVRRGIQGGRIDPNAQLQRIGTSDWLPAAVVLSSAEVARAPAPSMPMAEALGTLPGTGGTGPAFLRDLFRTMDGLPAHASILLGLLLVLLSPVITRTHAAHTESAAAELQHAQALMNIDLDAFRDTQTQALVPYENAVKSARLRVMAAQQSREGAKGELDAKVQKALALQKAMSSRPDPTQQQAFDAARADVTAMQSKLDEIDTSVHDAQIKAAQAESRKYDFESKNLETNAKALEAKRQELLATYDIKTLQRAEVDARTQSQGTTAAVHLQWLGRFFFLVGLLVVALNAWGTRQKVVAAVLLLSLFSWLTPVGFDFLSRFSAGREAAPSAPAPTVSGAHLPTAPASASPD